MAKKAKKKAIPDPIKTVAKDLKDKLNDKRADLKDQYTRERDPNKKEVLKLELCVIGDLVDDLDRHILNRPFTSFRCP